jgi:5'-deoxynucleotidase YfbR-like HD superfamily hydrolase
MKTPVWIQTYSGKKFQLLSPKIEDISIIDIAHALSMQCRFTGHTKHFYSIAQHSVFVSQLCYNYPLYGLLHDASEAYLSDISSPLKNSGYFENYKHYENNLQELVFKKFIGKPESNIIKKEVKEADLELLAIESFQLMQPLHPEFKAHLECNLIKDIKIEELVPSQARNMFLDRYIELTGDSSVYTELLKIQDGKR